MMLLALLSEGLSTAVDSGRCASHSGFSLMLLAPEGTQKPSSFSETAPFGGFVYKNRLLQQGRENQNGPM